MVSRNIQSNLESMDGINDPNWDVADPEINEERFKQAKYQNGCTGFSALAWFFENGKAGIYKASDFNLNVPNSDKNAQIAKTCTALGIQLGTQDSAMAKNIFNKFSYKQKAYIFNNTDCALGNSKTSPKEGYSSAKESLKKFLTSDDLLLIIETALKDKSPTILMILYSGDNWVNFKGHAVYLGNNMVEMGNKKFIIGLDQQDDHAILPFYQESKNKWCLDSSWAGGNWKKRQAIIAKICVGYK